jgi:hypothetical protein
MPDTSASPERKRRKSADPADPVAPELAGACSERLVQCLATGRTSTEAVLAVFDALDAMPHVASMAPEKVPNAREAHVRHLILLDKLFEATTQARAKAKVAWQRTPWALHGDNNFLVVDGQDEPDGSAIPDGCAICGALKAECIDPGAHFGARGESPPDAKCKMCKMNFHNHYDSEHALQLHVAEKHAAKRQK